MENLDEVLADIKALAMQYAPVRFASVKTTKPDYAPISFLTGVTEGMYPSVITHYKRRVATEDYAYVFNFPWLSEQGADGSKTSALHSD